jgi:hypothetical protein
MSDDHRDPPTRVDLRDDGQPSAAVSDMHRSVAAIRRAATALRVGTAGDDVAFRQVHLDRISAELRFLDEGLIAMGGTDRVAMETPSS